MTDDWKTLRVPPDAYDDAKAQKETADRTWGEQIVRPEVDGTPVYQPGDPEPVDELADEIIGKIGMAADPGVVMDDDAVADLAEQVRELQALVDTLPDRTAEQTADELEGRFIR